jgi:peptidoglycan/LPS O-acetylase OafA/YrhL
MEQRPTLPALTGLRFFAALAILAFHFVYAWGGRIGPPTGPVPILLVSAGYEAVSCFFVLSGFVLAYAYLDDSGKLRGSAAHFYRARFARIYPIYAVSILVAFIPFAWWFHADWSTSQKLSAEVATLFLLQGWWPTIDSAINVPSWSLSVEALFYLLFPVLVVCTRRIPPLYLAAIAWLLCMLPPLLYEISGHPGGADLAVAIHANPAIRLPEFLIGVAAGRFFTARTYTPQHAGPLSILALAAVPLGILATTHAPYSMRFDGLIVPAWALLIVMLAWGRGPLAVLLGTRPLVALGDVSYGIYILHWPIHDLLTQRLWPWEPKSGGSTFVIYVALCCSAALLSARYIERPARRILTVPLSHPIVRSWRISPVPP